MVGRTIIITKFKDIVIVPLKIKYLESNNIVIISIKSNIRKYISPKYILILTLKIFALRILVYLIISLPCSVNFYLALIASGFFFEYYHTNKCNIKISINYIFNNKIEFLISKLFSFIVVSFLILFCLTTLIIMDTCFNTNIFPLLSKSCLMMVLDTTFVSGYLVFMEGMGSGGNNPLPPQGPQGPLPPQGPQPPQGPHTHIPITSKKEQNKLFHDSEDYVSEKKKLVDKLHKSFIDKPEKYKTFFMNDPSFAEIFTPLDFNTICKHFAHHPTYKCFINTNQEGDFVYSGKVNKPMIYALTQPMVRRA